MKSLKVIDLKTSDLLPNDNEVVISNIEYYKNSIYESLLCIKPYDSKKYYIFNENHVFLKKIYEKEKDIFKRVVKINDKYYLEKDVEEEVIIYELVNNDLNEINIVNDSTEEVITIYIDDNVKKLYDIKNGIYVFLINNETIFYRMIRINDELFNQIKKFKNFNEIINFLLDKVVNL